MYSDFELIEEFNTNLTQFYESNAKMRDEIFRSYDYRDGDQVKYIKQDAERYKALGETQLYAMNIAAPIVRAVAGSEVMSASTLDFISTSPEYDPDADIIGDVVEWCQYASNYYSQRNIAAEDAATCGIGATVTYSDMTKKNFIAGYPKTMRIFPAFLAYDTSARGSQLNENCEWAMYADPVSKKFMDGHIKRAKGKKTEGASEFSGYLISEIDSNYFNSHVEFIYHYFWREFVDIYDIKNPFDDPQIGEVILQDPDVANLIGSTMKELELDWRASYWTVDKEDFDAITTAMEVISGLYDGAMNDLEYSVRQGYCYCRSEFARGMLLRKSKSYSTKGHALNFITGYYDEVLGYHYGLMRPLSEIQDALNIGFNRMMRYVDRVSHGGAAYVSGAADALERVKKGRINEEDLTVLPEGAQITPKASGDAPVVLQNFVQMMIDVMPRVLGLGQEFFGVVTSGDMTDSLYGKIMKQSFAVLENWKNNAASYDIMQGYLYEDLCRGMAKANDGMVLPAINGKTGKDAQLRLTTQNLAREYAIRVVERPMTKDEKQDAFNKLSQIAPQALQAGINYYPILAKLAPFDADVTEEMVKVATPQPPQPDPLAQATTQATIAYTQASAQKAQAEAQRIMADLQLDAQKAQADNFEKITSAEYDKARTAQVIQETGISAVKAATEAVDKLFNPEGMNT